MTILFFLSLVLLKMVFPDKTAAQEISLAITPPILELSLKPGSSYLQPYEVTNNSGIDLFLRPIVLPFVPADLSGNVQLQSPEFDPLSATIFSLNNKNIQLNQTFKLPAGKTQRLLLVINLPEDAAGKDHYFTFLIEQSPQVELIGQSNSNNLIKIGSNILLTIDDGSPKRLGQLIKFSAVPKIADLIDSVVFDIEVANIGRNFFKTEGEIIVINQFNNKEMKKLKIRPDNILANSARQLVCLNNNQTEKCQFSSLIPGIYKAIIKMDSNIQIDKNFIIFWILPIKTLLVVVLMLTIVLLIKNRLLTRSKK